MSARDRALREVAQMVRDIGTLLDGLTAREAAERAWRPGGKSLAQLEAIALARGCRPSAGAEEKPSPI